MRCVRIDEIDVEWTNSVLFCQISVCCQDATVCSSNFFFFFCNFRICIIWHLLYFYSRILFLQIVFVLFSLTKDTKSEEASMWIILRTMCAWKKKWNHLVPKKCVKKRLVRNLCEKKEIVRCFRWNTCWVECYSN